MRIINWNARWATPESNNGILILQEIFDRNPEIVCVTEGHSNFFQKGYTIYSGADYGYDSAPSKRKVLLWSKNPWKEFDQFGNELLPPGRFVSGKTITSIGEVKIIGVCIPWRDAHVTTGRKDRKQWEDHLLFLEGLKRVLSLSNESPLILVGDFNQRIPRDKQPLRVFERLMRSLPLEFNIATVGNIQVLNKLTIDHVAHSKNIIAQRVFSVDNHHPSLKFNLILSDHFGVVVDFENT